MTATIVFLLSAIGICSTDKKMRCADRVASVKNFGLRALVMTTSKRSYHSVPTRYVIPLSLKDSHKNHHQTS